MKEECSSQSSTDFLQLAAEAAEAAASRIRAYIAETGSLPAGIPVVKNSPTGQASGSLKPDLDAAVRSLQAAIRSLERE